MARSATEAASSGNGQPPDEPPTVSEEAQQPRTSFNDQLVIADSLSEKADDGLSLFDLDVPEPITDSPPDLIIEEENGQRDEDPGPSSSRTPENEQGSLELVKTPIPAFQKIRQRSSTPASDPFRDPSLPSSRSSTPPMDPEMNAAVAAESGSQVYLRRVISFSESLVGFDAENVEDLEVIEGGIPMSEDLLAPDLEHAVVETASILSLPEVAGPSPDDDEVPAHGIFEVIDGGIPELDLAEIGAPELVLAVADKMSVHSIPAVVAPSPESSSSTPELSHRSSATLSISDRGMGASISVNGSWWAPSEVEKGLGATKVAKEASELSVGTVNLPPKSTSRKNRKCLIWSVAVALVLAIIGAGLGAYFALKPKPPPPVPLPKLPADLISLYSFHLHPRNFPSWYNSTVPSPAGSAAMGKPWWHFYSDPNSVESLLASFGRIWKRGGAESSGPAKAGNASNATFVAPTSSPSASSSHVWVVLGDSNSDNWNRYHYKPDFPPSPVYWKGRHSNGPMYPDYLSIFSGLPAVSNGMSGGTWDWQLTNSSSPGVLQQAQDAMTRLNKTTPYDGGRFTQLVGKTRLCVTSAGANDYGEMLWWFQPPNGAGPKFTVEKSIANIRDHVLPSVIQLLGCRILVVTTAFAPFAGFPKPTTMNVSTQIGAINTHDSLLPAAIDTLRQRYPQTEIILYKMDADCTRFGVTSEFPCTSMQRKPEDPVCGDPWARRLWDENHYTTQCHGALAGGMLEAIKEYFEERYDVGGL